MGRHAGQFGPKARWNVYPAQEKRNAGHREAPADNPGSGSLLTKAVTDDPGGPFLLTVTNGVEDAGSEKHGLTATTLTVDENFSVNAGSTLLSVSDTFFQGETIRVPEPGTLLLLAIGMLGAGWIGGRRGKRA
jgi:hypothetical protein